MEINRTILKVAIPKGRLFAEVYNLLAKAGYNFVFEEKNYVYRMQKNNTEIIIKIIKNRDIPQLVVSGYCDLGFASSDWIRESEVHVKEIADLGFGQVKIVAAIARNVSKSDLIKKDIVCATEYVHTANEFLRRLKLKYRILSTHGCSEGYLSDEVNMIIDTYETGESLDINNLKIWKVLFTSSVRLISGIKEKSDKVKEIQYFSKQVWRALKEKSF